LSRISEKYSCALKQVVCALKKREIHKKDDSRKMLIVLLTKIALARRIACLADNPTNTIFTEEMNMVGVAGSRGSGSKFIVASLKKP
jgi:hypothetical protein